MPTPVFTKKMNSVSGNIEVSHKKAPDQQQSGAFLYDFYDLFYLETLTQEA